MLVKCDTARNDVTIQVAIVSRVTGCTFDWQRLRIWTHVPRWARLTKLTRIVRMIALLARDGMRLIDTLVANWTGKTLGAAEILSAATREAFKVTNGRERPFWARHNFERIIVKPPTTVTVRTLDAFGAVVILRNVALNIVNYWRFALYVMINRRVNNKSSDILRIA